MGGRYEDDGRRRLLEFDTLIPEPTFLPDGSRFLEWRDGVHEDFFIWDTQVTYLFDAAGNGDFVVMSAGFWREENGRRLYTVPGVCSGPMGALLCASLVFDHVSGQLERVWAVQSDARQPRRKSRRSPAICSTIDRFLSG